MLIKTFYFLQIYVSLKLKFEIRKLFHMKGE